MYTPELLTLPKLSIRSNTMILQHLQIHMDEIIVFKHSSRLEIAVIISRSAVNLFNFRMVQQYQINDVWQTHTNILSRLSYRKLNFHILATHKLFTSHFAVQRPILQNRWVYHKEHSILEPYRPERFKIENWE